MAGDGAPFSFDGDDRGVLCLHGFTATPYEMRYLARHLAAHGMTVEAPLLPGHGTTPGDLQLATRAEWRAAVDQALDRLRKKTRCVAVVGESMGGLLALDVAARRPGEVTAVATLAAPLWFTGLSARVATLVKAKHWAVERLAYVPKLGGSDVFDRAAKIENPSYHRVPLRAFGELLDLMDEVKVLLPRVEQPTFVAHARHDHTAPFACAGYLIGKLGTSEVDSLFLAESYHLIAIDVERDQLAGAVQGFLEYRLRA